ncbi:uncharacterized protein LOC134813537 [Bolinopsis microptera]|uniref:uncharacterized protein LOC134813537 n=1 Tax=Bolinopsis microptera TaxID=2820187 RepID=UPI003079C397
MKVAVLALCLVFVAVRQSDAAIKCVQGDGVDQTAKVCDGAENKCFQPKFVEYTGMSAGVTYGCGPCDAKNVATCEDCVGKDDAACNIKKETELEFKCHDYELLKDATKLTPKKEPTTCQRLTATTIMCNMPGPSSDKTYTMVNKGCGPCSAADKTAKKCEECETAECNKPATPAIKCIQGDGSKDATVCTTNSGEAVPTKCHQPKFTEYTGLAAGQTYGCGPCGANDAAKCEDCVGKADAACNVIKATDTDFKCYDYELKEDKWTMKSTAGTCKRMKDTAVKCNMPGKSADKTYVMQNAGCGPCTDADKKATKCAECDKAECSNAFTITAFIVPLLATLYNLL